MADKFFMNHSLLVSALWVLLYTSDYYLTLLGARLSRNQNIIEFEGSYELTPQYQSDIDKLRKLSPTFIIWLLFGVVILAIPAIVGTDSSLAKIYGFYMGALIIPELVVHIRHFHNITLYRRLGSPDPGMNGHLWTSSEMSYMQSSTELASWAVVLFILYAFTWSPIIFGGAVFEAHLAYKHRKLAAKYESNPNVVKEHDTINN